MDFFGHVIGVVWIEIEGSVTVDFGEAGGV